MKMPSDLPSWRHVLAVVAHPDDESFGLGAVLSAFVAAGRKVSVLCLTRGEASTLHGVEGDLVEIRERELENAAAALGVAYVGLRGYPDGGLPSIDLGLLVDDIEAFTVESAHAGHLDGLLVMDPSGVTGHGDHQRATEAALACASAHGLPALGWTLPADVADILKAETGAPFVGHSPDAIDLVLEVDRTAQARAVACHPSQALPESVLWRRLELLGTREHLRWLALPGVERHSHEVSATTP